MTCMDLKKFKVFSSLRRPETHVRHAQGHQRTGALTGSINIFQSTISTVYEVEHQKTVNTKTWKKDYLVFTSYQEFYQYFQENTKNGRDRRTESRVALHF